MSFMLCAGRRKEVAVEEAGHAAAVVPVCL